jgi:uncharacterized protein (DUF2236 family)
MTTTRSAGPRPATAAVQPHEDYGFFGPGSVTWKVVRPRLAASEIAVAAMAHLLDAKVMIPPMPWVARPLARVVSEVLRAGTIATMPRWMREMSGIRQSRIVDAPVRPILWTGFRVISLNPRAELLVLKGALTDDPSGSRTHQTRCRAGQSGGRHTGAGPDPVWPRPPRGRPRGTAVTSGRPGLRCRNRAQR